MGLFSIFARIFAFQESQGHHGNLKTQKIVQNSELLLLAGVLGVL